ncbi:helix-turn-helix domain-containing protein [Bacteroides sp. GD17]|jgi:AraC-like DNA-binding protein|uniref:helix-turn-helix domain-containing protein n=1 Tax=Bacteroides sp. GD17 TaxID=3139826 RepID=UPI0025F5FFA1|nr:helix-turn-helix domain-containing protein [uncultured Bacteroides sp.]
MEFPQVDLPVDTIAWTEVTEDVLNIYKQSCRLKACIFALCLEGSIKVSINLMDSEIKQGDFITLLPGTIIQFYEQKEKVRLGFVGFSSHCLNGVNLIQSTLRSFSTILEYPVLTVEPTVASYFKDYFALLARITTGPYPPDTRTAQNTLSMLLQGIDRMYSNRPYTLKNTKNRKEEICRELVQLVIENYTHERRAQFYADKLGISLQHLSTTVKVVTGKNVLDIIAHVVIVDVKAKLKSTNMTIQEIAYSLNFPSASFFGKYFKRHMGMSPLEYRNS